MEENVEGRIKHKYTYKYSTSLFSQKAHADQYDLLPNEHAQGADAYRKAVSDLAEVLQDKRCFTYCNAIK